MAGAGEIASGKKGAIFALRLGVRAAKPEMMVVPGIAGSVAGIIKSRLLVR